MEEPAVVAAVPCDQVQDPQGAAIHRVNPFQTLEDQTAALEKPGDGLLGVPAQVSAVEDPAIVLRKVTLLDDLHERFPAPEVWERGHEGPPWPQDPGDLFHRAVGPSEVLQDIVAGDEVKVSVWISRQDLDRVADIHTVQSFGGKCGRFGLDLDAPNFAPLVALEEQTKGTRSTTDIQSSANTRGQVHQHIPARIPVVRLELFEGAE